MEEKIANKDKMNLNTQGLGSMKLKNMANCNN